MKKLALLFALLFASPALAADNAVIVTPGVGVTMKSKDVGAGVQAMQPVLSDTGGNALSTPTAGADGVSNTATGLLGYGRNLVFNGTTWDRWLGDATNGGFVNVKTSVLPTGAGTAANQSTINTSIGTTNTNLGAPGATVCATDTGSCSLNALFQRALQSLTTIGTNTGAAVPSGTARIGYTSDDPCTQKIKLNAPFTTTSAGPASIVALSGSTVIYICAISAIADTAIKLSFIDGTGGSCASAQHAIWGSTTAANGMSLAANGGFTMGSGNGSVGVTTAASAFCLLQSGTSLVAGNLTYVQQ